MSSLSNLVLLWLAFIVVFVALVIHIVADFSGAPVTPKTCPHSIDKIEKLDDRMRAWYRTGLRLHINGFHIFTRLHKCLKNKRGHLKNDPRDPVVLLHGFPSSSFEFARVVGPLCEAVGPVVTFDHVGFGFSDKPRPHDVYAMMNHMTSVQFSYSVIDHAENFIMLLQDLNITRAHTVCHDVGCSVLNEALGRKLRGQLPAELDNVFRSVVFTNGGSIYRFSQPRIGQVLLAAPIIGPVFQHVLNRWDGAGRFLKHQLRTVWPHDLSDTAQRDSDIEDISAMLHYNGGHLITNELIRYINDRKMFENRWHPSLTHVRQWTNSRCGIVWGDSDAVAPSQIATQLQDGLLVGCSLDWLKGAGHFVQLERPLEWVQAVARVALRKPDGANAKREAAADEFE